MPLLDETRDLARIGVQNGVIGCEDQCICRSGNLVILQFVDRAATKRPKFTEGEVAGRLQPRDHVGHHVLP